MSVSMKLYDINEQIEALQDTLESMEGISKEEEIAMVKNMLDMMEGARDEKLISIARWRKRIKVEADEVIGGEVKRLQDRKASYKRRYDSLGDYLLYGVEQSGGKIKNTLGTLYTANSKPVVEITDIKLIPLHYMEVVQEISQNGYYNVVAGNCRVDIVGDRVLFSQPDKKFILDNWLTTGKQIPGAIVKQGKYVGFR